MLLRQLEYLTALARERHFARAAKACYVSQPALSAAIRKLEAELGVPIVRRGNRFVGFTSEGERILVRAHRILAERDGLDEAVRAMRGGLSGRLRIGIIPTAVAALPLLTARFSTEHPLVRISVESMSSNDIQRRLADYELDVGVTYIDDEPLSNVRATLLYREHYLLLTGADSSLARRRSVTWAEAAQVPLCLFSEDMQNRRVLNRAFRQAGSVPAPTVETNSISALYAHVRQGTWATVVPHAWLHLYDVPDGMRVLPLRDPEVSQGIGLVVHDRDPQPVLARALLDVARRTDVRKTLDRLLPD